MKSLFETNLESAGEVGYVVRVLNSILEVEGLPTVSLGEMVVFETGEVGQVSGLDRSKVEIVVLSDRPVSNGTRVVKTGKKMQVEVSESLLGTTVNVVGKVLRTWGTPKTGEVKKELRNLDNAPTGIVGRKRITRQMTTGMVMVDTMIPIGYGQRELIMGDRKTGKSYLLWHTIANQAKIGSICIYAAVGKKKTEIVRSEELFKNLGIAEQTIIVAANLSDSPGEIFMAPYTAMTIAEFFRDQGRDVVLVLDDMTTHAKFYRELSLISRKFPGRDSYPGDIFHIHSRLMERAGNFSIPHPKSLSSDKEREIDKDGYMEVSITCLPIVETVAGDVTGYIQTNMMSMTDGHIYFDTDLFFRGRRPAINSFISVTRVGRQTQRKITKDAGRALYDLFNAYEKTQSFMRFGAELGENSRQILVLGDKVLKFFDQPNFIMVPVELGVVLVGFLISGLWDGKGMTKAAEAYQKDLEFKQTIDKMFNENEQFNKLIEQARKEAPKILPKLI